MDNSSTERILQEQALKDEVRRMLASYPSEAASRVDLDGSTVEELEAQLSELFAVLAQAGYPVPKGTDASSLKEHNDLLAEQLASQFGETQVTPAEIGATETVVENNIQNVINPGAPATPAQAAVEAQATPAPTPVPTPTPQEDPEVTRKRIESVFGRIGEAGTGPRTREQAESFGRQYAERNPEYAAVIHDVATNFPIPTEAHEKYKRALATAGEFGTGVETPGQLNSVVKQLKKANPKDTDIIDAVVKGWYNPESKEYNKEAFEFAKKSGQC